MIDARFCKLLALVLIMVMVASNTVQAAKQSRGGKAKAEASGPAVARPAPVIFDAGSTATKVVVAPTEPVGLEVLKPWFGQKVERGPAMTPLIALSFDDGPSPKLTPLVLETLKKEGIKANFFLIGQEVQRFPECAKMVADAGMELGCHTMTHPNLGRKSPEIVSQEIGDSQKIIEQATGKKPFLFRAPGGVISGAVRQSCTENGLIIVGWSVDPKDWNPRSTSDTVYNMTMRQIHGGAIICIHDIHKKTVEALPRIITELKAKGYVFTTISQLVAANAQAKVAPSGGMAAAGTAAGSFDPGAMGVQANPASISLSESSLKK